jgi:hypothetical protein
MATQVSAFASMATWPLLRPARPWAQLVIHNDGEVLGRKAGVRLGRRRGRLAGVVSFVPYWPAGQLRPKRR